MAQTAQFKVAPDPCRWSTLSNIPESLNKIFNRQNAPCIYKKANNFSFNTFDVYFKGARGIVMPNPAGCASNRVTQ